MGYRYDEVKGWTQYYTPSPILPDESEDSDTGNGPCYQWSQDDILLMNAGIRIGIDDAETMIKKHAKLAVKVPYERPVIIDDIAAVRDANNMHAAGEGVGGVEFITNRPAKRERTVDDNLGLTSRGVPIKFRMKLNCNFGHRVEGDNVYINPATGQQLCRQCMNDRHKRHNDIKNNKRRNR